MDRVFISYSRKNQTFAERLARDLDDAGLEVWIDLREIQAGELWQEEIFRGIEASEFVIACLSPSALSSAWVRRELQLAREQHKPIFPVMVIDSLAQLQEDEGINWLLDVQFINFEDRYEQAFPELLRALPGGRALGSFDQFDPENIPNPFKGLEAFQQTDAALFFGREELTRKAIQRLRRTSFLAVVGASGSGKSSLVRAGIIPQLRSGVIDGSDDWPILIFSPGAHPIEALAKRLNPLLAEKMSESYPPETLMEELRISGSVLQVVERALQGDPESTRLLLVVDQFEEVFTRTSETERIQFLDALRLLATVSGSRAHIIVTMRADFFGQLSHYPDLANLFEQDNLLIVTEMTTANLLRSIEGPAQAVGLRYEQGLVDRLLDDVKSEPGSLPLLQYALRELFKRREGAKLTNAAYDEIGGVRQALARHAESVFRQLNPARQDIMRRVLLRLVEVSESGEATRRRVPLTELSLRDVPPEEIDAVIELLTSPESRLLIANREISRADGEPTILLQVSHEALMREWDRFQTWVNASLDDLRYEAELRKAADNWDSNNRDEAYLLRGKRLNRAELWLEDHSITPLQRDFIEASISAEAERTRREEERLQRELQLQQKANRRFRQVIVVLFALFVGAVVAGLVVIRTNNQLIQTQDDLREAADRAQRLALAANAEQAFNDEDTDLALALAVEAADDSPNPPVPVQRTLADIALAPGTRLRIETPAILQSVALSADAGRVLAGTVLGEVLLHDVESGELLLSLAGHAGAVNSVLFSADGSLLVSASDDTANNLHVWDAETGELLHELMGHSGAVTSLALTPEGRLLSGGEDGQVFLWDLMNGERLADMQQVAYAQIAETPSQHDDAVTFVHASSDGAIASGDASSRIILRESDGTLRWDERYDNRNQAPSVTALAFSGDGARLLVGLSDGRLFIVNAATGEIVQEFAELSESVVQVAYIPGTRQFIASGADNTLRFWDLQTGRQVQAFDLDGVITAQTVSGDGRTAALGLDNRTLRLWSVQGSAEVIRYENAQRVSNVALNPDGTRLAAGSIGGVVQFWDRLTEQRLPDLSLNNNRTVTAIDFQPGGDLLAAGDLNGSVTLVDHTTQTVQGRFTAHGLRISALLFLPSGEQLLTGSSDETIVLWNVADRTRIRDFEGHTGRVTALALDAGSTRLFSGATDGSLFFWDLQTGERLRRFSGHQGSILSVDLNAEATLALSAAQDGTLRLWDTATGREIRRFEGHDGAISGAAFLPGAEYVLSGGQDGTLRLWDLVTGEELRRYAITDETGRPVAIETLLRTPDGQLALTGLRDKSLRFWQLLPGNQMLLEWVDDNRFVPDLTCDQRLRFGVQEGDADFVLFGEQRFVDVPTTDFLSLREDPSPDAPVVGSLESGESLRLMAVEMLNGRTFYEVCTTEGLAGWVPADGLSVVE